MWTDILIPFADDLFHKCQTHLSRKGLVYLGSVQPGAGAAQDTWWHLIVSNLEQEQKVKLTSSV